MMRSMFSGVSGLKVHQTKMDVIGNNIANVNTVGYKSQRVTFSDVFSQTISASTSANDETGRGGVNAMQVGLGVNVSSIDMLMTQGAAQRTDNPFDLMINGDGFIIVGDTTGKYFTRAGALRQDDEGNLVISNGMKVQGWNGPAVYNATKEEYEIPVGQVENIKLGDASIKSSTPTVTKNAELSGNINSTDTSRNTSINFYDSQGNYYTLSLKLNKKQDAQSEILPNEWVLSPAKTETNSEGVAVVYATDTKGNEVTFKASDLFGKDKTTFDIVFGADGKIDDAQTPSFELGIGGNNTETGTTFNNIKVDISKLTQYATNSSIDSKTIDGNAAGVLSGYSIDNNGIIMATYSNGDIKKIAQIPLAQFDNPTGLEKVGDNVYAMTTNSGQFDGVGSSGIFNTGVLEMSNVDLSSEFTDMIVTQRGFQANSKIITVSDEMLQELTNLKR